MSLSTTNNLFTDVLQILQFARKKAYSAVNTEMVNAYWQLGKKIVEEEQNGEHKATYGEAILKTLSIALTNELGKGFSYSNLRNFRQFYLAYPNASSICYTVCSKLSWSHNRLIMRLENENARQYYLKESLDQSWSVRTLERNINTFYYERLLSTQNKKELQSAEDKIEKNTIEDFIKDPFIFDFLKITEPTSALEKDIETALINNLQQFLLELGKGFSFVGRQFRISTETSHFYIDLVFYNYLLKCFVLFDLKTTKLTHQDTGQMDMYIKMFDDLKKQENDNATIGIILCTEKDETIVKYSILSDSSQLFATKYMPYLPTETELIAAINRERKLIEGTINH